MIYIGQLDENSTLATDRHKYLYDFSSEWKKTGKEHGTTKYEVDRRRCCRCYEMKLIENMIAGVMN